MGNLTVSNLTYTINSNPILKNVNLSLELGKVIGIMGASGIGKTSLLYVIAGLAKPDSGEILYDDEVLTSDNVFVPPEKRGIGMVFQDYAVLPHLNVADNMLFGMKRVPKNERRERVDYLLDMVQLHDYKNRFPHELSGGQLQRVSLARVLGGNFRLIVFDEPFSNLENELSEQIAQKIKDYLLARRITGFTVSHNMSEIKLMCDDVFCLCDRGNPQRII